MVVGRGETVAGRIGLIGAQHGAQASTARFATLTPPAMVSIHNNVLIYVVYMQRMDDEPYL